MVGLWGEKRWGGVGISSGMWVNARRGERTKPGGGGNLRVKWEEMRGNG